VVLGVVGRALRGDYRGTLGVRFLLALLLLLADGPIGVRESDKEKVMNCIGIVKRTLVIARPAVLAAVLIIAFAADAVAGIHSDSCGEGGDIETRRWFDGGAYRAEGGRVNRKIANVGVAESIILRADGWHDLVFLGVGSWAEIGQDGRRDCRAWVMLRLTDDEILPYAPADKVEIPGLAYSRFSDLFMATTVGTQAVSYRLRFGASVTLDLVVSASSDSDSVVAEMRGSASTEGGTGAAWEIESGDMEVTVQRSLLPTTSCGLDFDMRATSKTTYGSWAKLTLRERKQYLALVGTDTSGAQYATVVTDDEFPAVNKYLYDNRRRLIWRPRVGIAR
jgi:hypothetical protein